MRADKLIVGLGNPGRAYAKTRHNAGALFVSDLAKRYHFPPLCLEKKFQAKLAQDHLNNQAVLLCLPQTFMNASGESVGELVRFFKFCPERDLLIVFDDLDLPVGQFKLTQALPRLHGGINSLKAELGDVDFWGLRLGTDDRAGKRIIPPSDYVLQNFPPPALTILSEQVFPAAREQLLQSWLPKA